LSARKEYTDSFYKWLKQKKTRSLSYRRCTLKKIGLIRNQKRILYQISCGLL
jgi:hypothetical protein